MMHRARATAAAGLVAVALTACPRMPPPAPRPHAHLLAIGRAGQVLTVRLGVDHPRSVRPLAVDWALAVGERDLVRGRAESLEIPIPLPVEVRPGSLVRLRGAVHLDGDGGPALAPFDEIARLP